MVASWQNAILAIKFRRSNHAQVSWYSASVTGFQNACDERSDAFAKRSYAELEMGDGPLAHGGNKHGAREAAR